MIQSTRALTGWRVLIAEDVALIASDVASGLEDEGATIAGPVATVSAAMDLIDEENDIGAAILDIMLADGHAFPIADALEAKDIPFVFVTGFEASQLPARFAGVPYLAKPAPTARLTQAFCELIAPLCPRQS